MIRHVVMFRFSEDVDESRRATTLSELAALPDLVPELRGFSVGRDVGLAEGNYDLVVVADLDDADGWRAYQANAEHQRVVTDHVKPLISARAAVQFEL